MAFVYMTSQQQVLMFGGSDSSGTSLSDTWTWKGGCWTQLSPAQSPSARDFAAATYDPLNGVVLLYGGTGAGQTYRDTWSWNGSTWSQLATSGPQMFGGPVAGFDPVTQSPILFGLVSGGTSQTWTWTGSSWKELSPSRAPSGRESPSLALDASRGQLMVFGGFVPNRGVVNDTWFWDGNTWTLASPTTSPPARFRAAMGSIAARRVVVLWGGVGAGVGLGDAWSWDGTNWIPISSIGTRADAAAVDVGSQLIVFGGDGPSGPYNDVATFDGVKWSAAA